MVLVIITTPNILNKHPSNLNWHEITTCLIENNWEISQNWTINSSKLHKNVLMGQGFSDWNSYIDVNVPLI